MLSDSLLIIVDELESNLDFKNHMLKLLLELKKQGKAIILNTHFPQNAYNVADRIFIMEDEKQILGTKNLINEEQLSQSFKVDFFTYLNLPS